MSSQVPSIFTGLRDFVFSVSTSQLLLLAHLLPSAFTFSSSSLLLCFAVITKVTAFIPSSFYGN